MATRIRLAPARDPEFKGLVERNNGYLETSFLPGRTFVSPTDFNAQLGEWLPRANARLVRSTGRRPEEALANDLAAMIALPPVAPSTGLRSRVRLARDYYVRVDSNDYSVDPRFISRFVDIHATAATVTITSGGGVVGVHERCWAKHATISDPAHVTAAKGLRKSLADDRQARERAERRHADGHPVTLRVLSDYDALFGSDFAVTTPTAAS
ncbi:hypothetical protein B7R22_18000 [Subtercola boreus]|uniref:Transposase for insertion sequence element IS21-like C-terminal domain-containing protein n=1 Tax=Subtercola boreus TaxID=120213 RepID=A0A3E0VQM1_9MICO|nr:hypothetical protein B7R22_18000 [Subtercola boreus]